MKIIFLDFDGVLNSRPFLLALSQGLIACVDGAAIDPLAVERLNHIVDATSAKVVVSSSWRHGSSLSKLRGFLEDKGFKGQVIDVTPDDIRGSRQDEIESWLSDNSEREIESFIAIDDSWSDFSSPSWLVKTTMAYGLQDEHIEQAIQILNA